MKPIPDRTAQQLAELRHEAWRVARHALGLAGGTDTNTEDAVQDAYLHAVRELAAGGAVRDLRTWFLRVTLNAARDMRRAEHARARREREAGADMNQQPPPGLDPAVAEEVRAALESLDERYRLPLVLCYECGLTQAEAAEVLGEPPGTVAGHISRGLDRLREMLGARLELASPAVILGALAAGAGLQAPARLAAGIESILRTGKLPGGGAAPGAVPAAVAAKGGVAMKAILAVVLAGTVAAGAAGLSAFGFRPSEQRDTADGPPTMPAAGSNPVAGRQDREEVFEFAEKPKATRQGDKVVITFASRGKCDATVAIVGPDGPSTGSGQGKIVRHLASGVLGKNAPWPFKQDSLSQSIEWDGRDDAGKPAPAGCKVRVSLGLQMTCDKSFGSFYGFNTKETGIGLVVDEDGFLYVVQDNSIRRFTRDGRYERTLMPPQGAVTPATFAGRPWITTVWGGKAIIGDWQTLFPNFVARNNPIGTPAFGPDGRLAVIWNTKNGEIKTELHLFGRDASLTPGSSMMFGDHGAGYFTGPYKAHKAFEGGGINHLAVSPDGEWLYVSGAGDAVLRYRWKELKGPRMPIHIFKGVADKTGNDNEHFRVVSGVSCDARGNVYIADNGNGRIQVYKADGSYLRTIKAEAPHRIAVHPKTGDIYALCWRSGSLVKDGKITTRLVKMDKDGKVLASLPVDSNWYFWHYPCASMALDAGAEPPAVWLADKKGIFKVTDKGNGFEEILRMGADRDKTVYADANMRLVADPKRDEVYSGSGTVFQAGDWVRFDGRTGKIDPTFKGMKAVEMAVGPDDLIYARVGPYGRYVVRYTREGQPVPFKTGVKVNGISGSGVAPGGDYTAIFLGNKGWSNVWQSGFDVSPNGDIVASVHEFGNDFLSALYPANDRRVPVKDLDMESLAKTGRTKDAYPAALTKRGFVRNSSFTLVQVWDRDGGEKCIAAFECPTRGSGVFMDAQGSLYAANCFTIPGKKGLESLGDRTAHGTPPGSLFKIAGKGDWPLARAVKGKDAAPLPGMTLNYREWTISGVTWAVQDASDTFNEQACGCAHCRFTLDRFARSWLPQNEAQAIMVYDTNGNRILRLGRYGNADSCGKDSLVPDPDIGLGRVRALAASDEALYISDSDNRRTLRAKLSYSVEEVVAIP